MEDGGVGMATVNVIRRERKGGVKYAVLYKDPLTLKTKYYKTYPRSKDAQTAAHRLRELIDNGRLLEIVKSKQKSRLMTFAEVADLLMNKWREEARPRRHCSKGPMKSMS